MRIHRTSLAATLGTLLLAALALLATHAPVAAAPQNPALMARVGENDDPSPKSQALAIGSLDIDVQIAGDTARTVVTAKFLNASRDILEGTFAFDLPPGSAVTGYALDVEGKMVDGVLVGHRKGTLAYEASVRRGIDPGLAEVNRAGAFTTRIYPIIEGKGRTVRLEFVTPLDPARPFTVPLVTAKPVGTVTIRVRTNLTTAPALHGPPGLALGWTRKGTGYEARATSARRALSGALVIGPVLAASVLAARHHNGEVFFEVSGAAPPAPGAAMPRRVRIYWDSSLSRRGSDLAGEIALVGRYLAAVRPQTVDLVFVATAAPLLRTFHAPRPEEVTAVLKAAEHQGGTTLAPVFDAGLPAADACLLFSDGNVTVDSYRVQALPCPLTTVSSVADANRALLAALARKSGGDYLDLGVVKPDAALARLVHRTLRVTAVGDGAGHTVDAAVLDAGGGRFRVIGRVPSSNTVVVTLAGAAQATRRFTIPRNAAASNDALGALWAAQRIGELDAADRPDQDALVALSRRYTVASAAAAFAVFESAGDYIAADATPPDSAGRDVLADYREAKAAHDEEEAAARRDRLAKVVKFWNEEKDWWARVFPTTLPPKVKPDTRPLGNMPPPPPPPPPRMAPSPTEDAPATNAITAVTGSTEAVVVTAERRGGDAGAEPSIAVEIAEWNPDRPYIKALNAADPATFWLVYRKQEAAFGNSPAFYLDVAEFLYRHDRRADAIKVALNALELPSANTTTMTVLADRLFRYGDDARALWLYERLLYLEPDRPQPRRNLALFLIACAERTGARAEPADAQRRDLARALDLLNEVITTPWAEAYDGIEGVSLIEANRIVPRLQALGVTANPLDKRLVALLDVDLRIILEWNTDQTDMDLWVDEPTGERAIYNHPRTVIGGRLSNDMTNGYGPEEYLLHKAPDGTYTVRANVYAADRINPNGATVVRAHVFHAYGRPNQREETLELELQKSTSGGVLIGTIKVKRD